jgi:hypothetical protein
MTKFHVRRVLCWAGDFSKSLNVLCRGEENIYDGLFKKKFFVNKKKPGLNPVPHWILIQQQSGSVFSNSLDPDSTREPAKYQDLDPKSDFFLCTP